MPIARRFFCEHKFAWKRGLDEKSLIVFWETREMSNKASKAHKTKEQMASGTETPLLQINQINDIQKYEIYEIYLEIPSI